MALKLDNSRGGATQKISEDAWGTIMSEPEVVYRPVPHRESTELGQPRPIWQVRFDLAYDPSRCFGLEINGEVILGRDTEAPGAVSLSAYDARALGVSREHAVLRPTETNLYLLDLGSTNGTWRNGHSIGVNMPYPVANGDLIRLGQLEFVVRIVKRPLGHTTQLHPKAKLGEALIPIARAIISKLDFNEVLKQTLEITMAVTSADEVSVWLVDDQTGELFLEASRGI
ncbi:MAG: FHA domain-containing protein, partial [Chloroflexota bacterium]